jgi:hypothetical protein
MLKKRYNKKKNRYFKIAFIILLKGLASFKRKSRVRLISYYIKSI